MPIDATQPYDDRNIFARILRGELPCTSVYEDEWALAFHDINRRLRFTYWSSPRVPMSAGTIFRRARGQ